MHTKWKKWLEKKKSEPNELCLSQKTVYSCWENIATWCSWLTASVTQAISCFGKRLFKPRCADCTKLQMNHNNLLYRCQTHCCTGQREQPRSIIVIKQSYCVSGGRAVSSSTLWSLYATWLSGPSPEAFTQCFPWEDDRRGGREGRENESEWRCTIHIATPLRQGKQEEVKKADGGRDVREE